MLVISHTPLHWDYFINLESDFINISKYIYISEDNYMTYSQELSKLYLSVCSEVDVVLKELCRKLDPQSSSQNITSYKTILNDKLPELEDIKVTLLRFNVTIKPFRNFSREESPFWWTDYQDVKHNRQAHFNKAHLKNCIESLSALFLTLLFLYKEDFESGKISPNPEIHRVLEYHYAHCMLDFEQTLSIEFN